MSRFETVDEPCTDCGEGGETEVRNVEYHKGVFTPLCGDCLDARDDDNPYVCRGGYSVYDTDCGAGEGG